MKTAMPGLVRCRRAAVGLLLAATLGACVHTTPQLDARFGNAVRDAMSVQIADPAAPAKADPVAGLDARAARAAIERYQQSFGGSASEPGAIVPAR